MSLAGHKRAWARAMRDGRWEKAATLVSITTGAPDPANLTAGPTITETLVPCRGYVSTWKQERFQGTEVRSGDRLVKLIAQSLGSTVPKINDKITIEGVTGRVIAVDRDGASAQWMCLVRG